eukprot:5954964-Prymnesium_polylepis.2
MGGVVASAGREAKSSKRGSCCVAARASSAAQAASSSTSSTRLGSRARAKRARSTLLRLPEYSTRRLHRPTGKWPWHERADRGRRVHLAERGRRAPVFLGVPVGDVDLLAQPVCNCCPCWREGLAEAARHAAYVQQPDVRRAQQLWHHLVAEADHGRRRCVEMVEERLVGHILKLIRSRESTRVCCRSVPSTGVFLSNLTQEIYSLINATFVPALCD